MATWITPKTFATGDYLTFVELNAAMGPQGALQWLKDACERIGVTADTGTQTVDSALVGGRVYGGSQEIPDSTWTPVVWSEQRYGRQGGTDIAWLVPEHPTLVHIPTKPAVSLALRGEYALGAHVAFAGNTTGIRGVRIVRKGALDLNAKEIVASRESEAVASVTEMPLSITGLSVVRIYGGDSFSVEVYQSSGDKLSLNASPNLSPEFWHVRLAAAA